MSDFTSPLHPLSERPPHAFLTLCETSLPLWDIGPCTLCDAQQSKPCGWSRVQSKSRVFFQLSTTANQWRIVFWIQVGFWKLPLISRQKANYLFTDQNSRQCDLPKSHFWPPPLHNLDGKAVKSSGMRERAMLVLRALWLMSVSEKLRVFFFFVIIIDFLRTKKTLKTYPNLHPRRRIRHNHNHCCVRTGSLHRPPHHHHPRRLPLWRAPFGQSHIFELQFDFLNEKTIKKMCHVRRKVRVTGHARHLPHWTGALGTRQRLAFWIFESLPLGVVVAKANLNASKNVSITNFRG